MAICWPNGRVMHVDEQSERLVAHAGEYAWRAYFCEGSGLSIDAGLLGNIGGTLQCELRQNSSDTEDRGVLIGQESHPSEGSMGHNFL
jgi:hypothetical protein